MLCTNCFAVHHFRSRCTNETACKACRLPGHKAGDDMCEALKSKAHKKVTAFQGKDDILSNFYPCEINCHGILVKLSQHAYQYVKAIRSGDLETAQNIKNAPTAFLAKQAARKLPYNRCWKDEKYEVMKDIIIEKTKQVKEFKDYLMDTKSSILVETVYGDYYWSCGLNKDDAMFTKKTYWFGENQMGKLLMELRCNLLEANKHQRKTKKKGTIEKDNINEIQESSEDSD